MSDVWQPLCLVKWQSEPFAEILLRMQEEKCATPAYPFQSFQPDAAT